jgi:hypothetical protein
MTTSGWTLELGLATEWPMFSAGGSSRPPADLATVTTTAERQPGEDGVEAAVQQVAGRLSALLSAERLQALQPYLLVAHGPWQPDSAAARHRRLWRTFPELADASDTALRSAELEYTSPRGVRFAAVMELEAVDVPAAVGLALTDSGCAIVARARSSESLDVEVERLFHAAFPAGDDGLPETSVDWRSLVSNVCGAGDVVVRVWNECGIQIDVVVFASQAIAESLAAQHAAPE